MKDIINKFKFKGDGIVINAPAELEKEFKTLGFGTSVDKKVKSKNTLVFVNTNKEYVDFLSKKLTSVEHDSVLWFAYPKGSSGIKTDINRDTLRATGEEFGITTVTAISINDTWSALRFRPIERVGK
ncbi:MAG: hypothetical protein JSS96_14210 [Bacteroidetes bacterium]|nr:hypothetical protein [Bacteroidota bacterium]